MKNAVDLEQDWFDDIVAHELEARMALVRCWMLARLPLKKVIQADNFVAVAQQPLA